MRKELETQLEEFLEKETKPFVDTLFTVLRTKSYLPYNTTNDPQAPQNGIHIPLDEIMSATSTSPSGSRKRAFDSDERDGRPTKGPRLGPDSHIARHGRGGRGGSVGTGRFNNEYGGEMMHRPPGGYNPPEHKRGICRDYYNSGFCSRGAFCKYSHGDDAVVPNQVFPMPNMLPFMFANGGMPFGGAYDPHESRIDLSRPQRPPVMSRSMQEGGQGLQQQSGELPVIQDLTPMLDGQQVNGQSEGLSMRPTEGYGVPMNVDAPIPGQRPRGGMRNGARGGNRNARGTFKGAHSLTPDQRTDKTLVVEKIPEDKLALDEVNAWFKKFGTVTNVAVDASSGKALVSFSSHTEAHAAWKSEEAVFGNRFVKVFWHRPMEGHGQAGAKKLAASAPLLANMSKQDAPVAGPSSLPSKPPAKKPAPSAALTALAEKQRLLDAQIAEQKTLMDSLGSASAQEKKDIMARLRKLGEEMKSTSSSSNPPTKLTTSTGTDQREMAKLDKELEMHAASGEGGETTEELKATLEKLQAEALSLGIPEADASSSTASSYRGGYRGRARAGGFRGAYTGRGAFRGGPPRASMKLDNRPKKLVLKGASSDNVQAIKDWYETTSQLESVDVADDGEIHVNFRTRAGAEQGMAKGTSIPTVDTVQISWFTNQPAEGKTKDPSPPTATTHTQPDVELERDPAPVEEDDEVVTGGWGGDGDGGM
jgi:RNA-binding protein 26